MDAAAAEAGIS